MKKISTLVLGLFLVISCSEEDPVEINDRNSDSQEILSVKEINSFIEEELKRSGDVDWTEAPANVLYSAVVHGNHVLSIGYGRRGESYIEGAKRSDRLNSALENIYKVVEDSEGISKSNTVLSEDDILNSIDVKITKLVTIETLQKTDQIRYLDPIGYSLYVQNGDISNVQKSAGCSQEGESINGGDYSVISPNSHLPWNFDIHNISQAWNYSTGAGITVGVIDTGISASQNLLGAGFNDGISDGRTVQRYGTYTDGSNDLCGHGTQMSAVLAAPRNNDYMPVGVAYNCNLVSYRATEDVILNGYNERKGVSNALKALGNRADVKIISMSIGYPWSIGNVEDAVKYAYGKGKMIFAAGGTSTSFTNWIGVIFPADMDETIAVTGIVDNKYKRCNNCHDGEEIDFTIVMQRAGNADRTVPVLGFNTGTRAYVGGSSVATATTAGIAALVWARNPNMSRAQVLDKLKRAGEFYPNRNNRFGYGNIDALKAVK